MLITAGCRFQYDVTYRIKNKNIYTQVIIYSKIKIRDEYSALPVIL